MILSNDIELRASQRMTDKNDGGGQMSNTVIENNRVNQLFGPISNSARLTGQVNLRQVHVSVNTATDDTYYGVGAIIDSKPTDANTNIILFKTGDVATTRPTAQRYLESYVGTGAISQMHPLGTQVSGSNQILAYTDVGNAVPSVGDIYILSVESGVNKGDTASFQVQSVSTYEDTFWYYQNESVTSQLVSFDCLVIVMDIAEPITKDFAGESPRPTRPGDTVIRRTTAAVSAEYHGISELKTAAAIGATTITVNDVLVPVVPVTQNETVSAEFSLARIELPLTVGVYSITVTDVVKTFALLVTSGNNGLTWSTPLSPIPAPGTLKAAYLSLGKWYELVDNGSGLLVGGDAAYGSGSINYTTGACVLSLGYDPDVDSSITFEWASEHEFTAITDATIGNGVSTLDFDLTGANVVDVLYWSDGSQNSFRFVSPQTHLSFVTDIVPLAIANWTSGDISVTWSALPDVNTAIECVAMNATESTSYIASPFWNDAWLVANPKLATFTVSPTTLAAYDKYIEYPVSVYDGSNLIAVNNPLRPVGATVKIKWNPSGDLYVSNWLRTPTSIDPSPIGTINVNTGDVSVRLEFEATVESVVYTLQFDNTVSESIVYTFDGSVIFPARQFKRVFFMMDGVEHFAIYYGDIAFFDGFSEPQTPPYFYATIDAITSIETDLNPPSATIGWKRVPETPNIRLVAYDAQGEAVVVTQLDPSTARPRIVNVTIPDSTLLTRFYTPHTSRTVPMWYNVDVFKNGSATAMTADDTITPIFNVVELTWNEHGVLIPIWLRPPVTMTPSSIGSITPLTNTITLTADFTVTAGGNTYDVKIKDTDGNIYFFTHTITTEVEYSKPHGVTTLMSVNTQVGNALVTEVRRQSFPLTGIKLPVITGITGDIMPGSFRMRLSGYEYHDEYIGGNLYRCAVPWSESDKEVAGSVDRANRNISLSKYESGTISNITNIAFCMAQTDRYERNFYLRTPMANIRPGTLVLSATASDGHIIVGSSNPNGEITDTANPHELTGSVDQQHGYIELRFVPSVQPGSIRYSCVFVNTLPITAEDLGVDPGRFPSSGKVPIFYEGNPLVIHKTGSINLANPAVAGSVIDCGVTHVSRIRVLDKRSRILPYNVVDYGSNALLSCLDAGAQDSYEFWEITAIPAVLINSLTVLSNVATATVTGGHGFYAFGGVNPSVTIAGATPAGLNGLHEITIVSGSVFTFTTTGIADGTATGAITASTSGEVWVDSDTDLASGLVQLSDPLDLTGYEQPLKLEFTQEHTALVTNVLLDGSIAIDRGPIIQFPVGSYVSSQLSLGDLFPRYTNVFSQDTWTNEWSDAVLGDPCDPLYNDLLYPLELTGAGTVSDRWRIEFQTTTAFICVGEISGHVGSGTITSDFAPAPSINPTVPYFTLRSGGWSGYISAGNVLRFNTVRNGVFWVARCIMPSNVESTHDQFGITFRGEVSSV